MSIVRLMAHTSYGGTGGILRVGKKSFPIPADSRVHHVGNLLAYVFDVHHGGVYAFSAAGQVTVPDELAGLLRAKYFPETDSTK